MMEFHSPQAGHLPAHLLVTAPQAWQTKAREGLAMLPCLNQILAQVNFSLAESVDETAAL